MAFPETRTGKSPQTHPRGFSCSLADLLRGGQGSRAGTSTRVSGTMGGHSCTLGTALEPGAGRGARPAHHHLPAGIVSGVQKQPNSLVHNYRVAAPTPFSNKKQVYSVYYITADRVTWLVYILKKKRIEFSFDLSHSNTAHLFYSHVLDCPFLIIQLD